MGAAYKLCDCRFNDTRLEENVPMLINQEILNLNNSTISATDNKNFSFLENLKRKNASNLIIRNYRQYKIRTSFDVTSRLTTQKFQTIKNNDNSNLDNEKHDLNTLNLTYEKFSRQKTLLYLGEKINGSKEGFGIKIMPNDVKYIGTFKNNKSEGYGKFININKQDIYYGEFSNDQANGFGIYRHKNDSLYYGEWKNDLRENYGIEKWRDNSEYIGEFHLGEKNGVGKYIFNDGSRYEGEWNKNNLDGYGIYYYSGNRIYIGQWKNNLKEGYGQFIWKDKIYVGFYKDDKKKRIRYLLLEKIKKSFYGILEKRETIWFWEINF